MRFFRFIIFILLINSIISFAAVLNMKMAFGNPDRLKSILKESDAYNIASAAIRENIVKQNAGIDSGNLFETLNEKVGPSGLQTLAEDFIDQLYDQQSGGKKEIVLKYSLLQEKLGPDIQLPADKPYTFESPVLTFANLNKMLWASFISLLLALALHITLIGSTSKQKLKWLGISLILSTISFAGIVAALFLIPNTAQNLMQTYQIESQKIANALIKAIQAVIDTQKVYYYIELGATLSLSVILFVLSKIAKEDGPTVIPKEPVASESLVK